MSAALQPILDALAGGEALRAIALLRALFQAQPTLANARVVTDAFQRPELAAEATPCRVWFLRSFTVEPIFPLLRASGLVHGLDVQARAGDFNAYAQEILDPKSPLYAYEPDVVFLAVQTRDLLPDVWDRFAELAPGEAEQRVTEATAQLGSLIKTLRSRSRAKVVIFDFAPPAWPSTGLLDAQLPGGQASLVARLNQALRDLSASEVGVHVLPFDALVARVGRDRFYDERKWLTVRLPLSAASLWPVAEACLRTLLPLTGKVRKAVVVDLDNTLWGGVVGEDGPQGIKIGAEYPGAAFRAFQRALLDLYERGVILAIASKNNTADAMEVLENHPGMLLRPHHFAAMRIDWNDKAQSLRAIAQELNIGVDSLVFVDDNPVERERVRSEVPEVYVIDLPAEPMDYAAALRGVPVLERVALSAEDRERGRLYVEQRERAALQQAAGSLEDFYRSLQMTVTVAPLGPETVTRVAQLTQKTNQFNLTTRRYDEPQIAQMMADPLWRVRTCGVRDRFGDNGLVGVVLSRADGDAVEIDTFLLSCRVIGRTVETSLLARVVAEARAAGARTVRGWFLPTKKNAPAKEFYASHGFRPVSEREDGGILWELDLESATVENPPWIAIG
jgi:FkbH-like protein